MNFKKSKEEIINDAYWRAQAKISTSLSSRLSSDPGPQSIRYALEQAVAEGIREAIRSLVENIYTDEEFEKDLTLRP